MDLEIEEEIRKLAGPAVELTERAELRVEVLGEIEDPREAALAVVEVPQIKKLRERHHHLARALASGMTNAEAALATGYSETRISILLDDPTFVGLVEFYRGRKDEQFTDVQRRLAALALDATAELADRLEERPETFKIPDLIKVATMGLDRTGHGPTSRVQIEKGLSEDALQRIRMAAEEGKNVRKKSLAIDLPFEEIRESDGDAGEGVDVPTEGREEAA